MDNFDIFSKFDNDRKRQYFYEYQKSRNSKKSYGMFLKDLETYRKLQEKLTIRQLSMIRKYGDFHTYLKDK